MKDFNRKSKKRIQLLDNNKIFVLSKKNQKITKIVKYSNHANKLKTQYGGDLKYFYETFKQKLNKIFNSIRLVIGRYYALFELLHKIKGKYPTTFQKFNFAYSVSPITNPPQTSSDINLNKTNIKLVVNAINNNTVFSHVNNFFLKLLSYDMTYLLYEFYVRNIINGLTNPNGNLRKQPFLNKPLLELAFSLLVPQGEIELSLAEKDKALSTFVISLLKKFFQDFFKNNSSKIFNTLFSDLVNLLGKPDDYKHFRFQFRQLIKKTTKIERNDSDENDFKELESLINRGLINKTLYTIDQNVEGLPEVISNYDINKVNVRQLRQLRNLGIMSAENDNEAKKIRKEHSAQVQVQIKGKVSDVKGIINDVNNFFDNNILLSKDEKSLSKDEKSLKDDDISEVIKAFLNCVIEKEVYDHVLKLLSEFDTLSSPTVDDIKALVNKIVAIMIIFFSKTKKISSYDEDEDELPSKISLIQYSQSRSSNNSKFYSTQMNKIIIVICNELNKKFAAGPNPVIEPLIFLDESVVFPRSTNEPPEHSVRNRILRNWGVPITDLQVSQSIKTFLANTNESGLSDRLPSQYVTIDPSIKEDIKLYLKTLFNEKSGYHNLFSHEYMRLMEIKKDAVIIPSNLQFLVGLMNPTVFFTIQAQLEFINKTIAKLEAMNIQDKKHTANTTVGWVNPLYQSLSEVTTPLPASPEASPEPASPEASPEPASPEASPEPASPEESPPPLMSRNPSMKLPEDEEIRKFRANNALAIQNMIAYGLLAQTSLPILHRPIIKEIIFEDNDNPTIPTLKFDNDDVKNNNPNLFLYGILMPYSSIQAIYSGINLFVLNLDQVQPEFKKIILDYLRTILDHIFSERIREERRQQKIKEVTAKAKRQAKINKQEWVEPVSTSNESSIPAAIDNLMSSFITVFNEAKERYLDKIGVKVESGTVPNLPRYLSFQEMQNYVDELQSIFIRHIEEYENKAITNSKDLNWETYIKKMHKVLIDDVNKLFDGRIIPLDIIFSPIYLLSPEEIDYPGTDKISLAFQAILEGYKYLRKSNNKSIVSVGNRLKIDYNVLYNPISKFIQGVYEFLNNFFKANPNYHPSRRTDELYNIINDTLQSIFQGRIPFDYEIGYLFNEFQLIEKAQSFNNPLYAVTNYVGKNRSEGDYGERVNKANHPVQPAISGEYYELDVSAPKTFTGHPQYDYNRADPGYSSNVKSTYGYGYQSPPVYINPEHLEPNPGLSPSQKTNTVLSEYYGNSTVEERKRRLEAAIAASKAAEPTQRKVGKLNPSSNTRLQTFSQHPATVTMVRGGGKCEQRKTKKKSKHYPKLKLPRNKTIKQSKA